MVFKGKIDAKTKALVKFLREESLLTVQEITKRCGVSRGTVYRCLKADKTTSNKKITWAATQNQFSGRKNDRKKYQEIAENRR